jgi:hypothetical protein
VDSRDWPEEAACLETRPYAGLLERVERGPDEPTLWPVADPAFRYRRLLETPERFRGRVVFGTGYVLEIRRVEAPGVGRTDRNEVHAGLMAEMVPDLSRGARRTSARDLDLRLWSFRAIRRPADARFYPGDRVRLSGYFLKNVPVVGSGGDVYWTPLVVSPWPTYLLTTRRRALPRWIPAFAVRRAAQAFAPGLLPTREYPHGELRSRPVLDVRDAPGEDGLALDGRPFDRGAAVRELTRFASRHPGRAVVVRAAGPGGRALAEGVLEEAGVERYASKELLARGGTVSASH